ncbi:ribonuclease P [Halobacteriales archaeon QS_3_64_16]|nr:MAG: ribonuclease P [Halobacteriales archaeon QS_3_64_16]
MCALPKHLRPRWRYLAVEIEREPDASLDRRAFQRALWKAARELLGDPGSADCDLTVMRFRFDETGERGEVIVRVRREEREEGRAALACVSDVGGGPVGIHVRGTSGTIRACEERHLGGRPDSGTETSVPFAGADRPAREQGSGRVDIHVDEQWVGATTLDVETETPDREGRE